MNTRQSENEDVTEALNLDLPVLFHEGFFFFLLNCEAVEGGKKSLKHTNKRICMNRVKKNKKKTANANKPCTVTANAAFAALENRLPKKSTF